MINKSITTQSYINIPNVQLSGEITINKDKIQLYTGMLSKLANPDERQLFEYEIVFSNWHETKGLNAKITITDKPVMYCKFTRREKIILKLWNKKYWLLNYDNAIKFIGLIIVISGLFFTYLNYLKR